MITKADLFLLKMAKIPHTVAVLYQSGIIRRSILIKHFKTLKRLVWLKFNKWEDLTHRFLTGMTTSFFTKGAIV